MGIAIFFLILCGFYLSDQANLIFAQKESVWLSQSKNSLDLSNYSKRAEGHLFLYLLLGDPIDKNKFSERTTSLFNIIASLESSMTEKNAKKTLSQIKIEANQLRSNGLLLLKTRETASKIFSSNFSQEEKGLIKRFHISASEIRRVGLELAKNRLDLISKEAEKVGKNLISIQRNTLFLVGSAFLVFYAWGVWFGRSIINPLGKLKAWVVEKGKSNFYPNETSKSSDEIDDLAKEFNKMHLSKEANEKLLNSLSENTTSVMYLKDLDGKYLFINKRFEELFNLKNENVKGKTDFEIFPDEIARKFFANDQVVIKSGEALEFEEFAPHSDGLHTYLSIKTPLVDPSGINYGTCGISTDISDRKRIFEKLKSSEEKLKSYFEMPLIGIAITSPEKGWLEVNQKLCEIFGYTREELTQMTWFELTYPDDLEADIGQFDRVLAGEIEGYSMEKRFVRKGNRIIHASISARCIRKADGNVDYFVAIVEDITERKEIEEQILNESKFASENPFPTMRVCSGGKFIYLNKSAEKISRKYNFKLNHPVPEAWQDNLGRAFSSREIIEFEDEIEGRTYSFNMVPMIDRDYLNIYGLDITSRKKAEKDLEAFASIASHDLQAPLRKISLFGDRLKQCAINLDEKSISYIHRMQNSALQMSCFIEDMLHFSVVSEERLTFDKIDLQEQVNGICEELSHIILAANGKIDFSNLPNIYGNKNQINQLLINLITNSLKYIQKGKNPYVNITAKQNKDGSCEISIEDNGIGFDEKYTKKIFEPFQRLHGRNEYEGTGLGLTICKKIVDRHNGTLSVKSRLGEGATFIVMLPGEKIN